MCIFTRSVQAVSDTRIFARAAGGGRQYLAYEMSFGAAEDLAMVLPLPVASRDERTAVRFIDLSATPDFFDRLGKLIVMFEEFHVGSGPDGMEALTVGSTEIRPPLLVHEVGAFDASFVPSIADFDRLDKRFQLSPEVWSALPVYGDYGFAVFRLRATAGKPRHAHPMAFEFSTRFPDRLFIPTVHVHDGGSVPRLAWFDHMIYAQGIRWPAIQEGHYEHGIRGEGEQKTVLSRAWSGSRERGDWRYGRAGEGKHERGLVLCGRPADPLAEARMQNSDVDDVLRRWREVPLPVRTSILRLVRDEAAIARGEHERPEVVAALLEATPGQRRAWSEIGRWMDIQPVLGLQAATLGKWRDLNEVDRGLALRGMPPAGDDAAARAWLGIDEKQRKNFGKLERWSELPELLESRWQQILDWMALPAGRQKIVQRVVSLKGAVDLFERLPALAEKYYGRSGGLEGRKQVMAALLDAEAGGETGVRDFLTTTEVATWWLLPMLDRFEEIGPLFDASQKLYGLGLTGMLANEDTFLDAA